MHIRENDRFPSIQSARFAESWLREVCSSYASMSLAPPGERLRREGVRGLSSQNRRFPAHHQDFSKSNLRKTQIIHSGPGAFTGPGGFLNGTNCK
jgi:hypothetical protein